MISFQNCRQLYKQMSSIGLSGMSNISTDALQTRYQKALKQINKLIEINRQLKETATTNDQQILKMNNEITNLQQTSRELDEENNIMESKYMELEGHYHQLETYCKKLEDQLEESQHHSQQLGEAIRENQEKYHQEMESQVQKYNALEKEADLIHQGYQENEAVIHLLEQQKIVMLAKIEEYKGHVAVLQQEKQRLSNLVKQKHIEQLRHKIENGENCIAKLMAECNELKGKQIDMEVQEEKVKVQRFIGININGNQMKHPDAVRQLIQQYKRKIKQTELQKKELYQKYKILKSKLTKSPSKENYHRKIQCLERLTEKQQQEIAKMIETYDRQLNNLHKDNGKLKQSYHSLANKFNEKITELNRKQSFINQLKCTTQRINFQNESLKKINNSLIETQGSKLKDLEGMKNLIERAESFTIQSKPNNQQFDSMNVKDYKFAQLKKTQQNTTIRESSNQQTVHTSFENMQNQSQKVPITVRYSSPNDSKGNFKFIQSVNIINGYNVNLSQNANRP